MEDVDNVQINIDLSEKWVQDAKGYVEDARQKVNWWACKADKAMHKEKRWRELLDKRREDLKDRENNLHEWKEALAQREYEDKLIVNSADHIDGKKADD